MHVILFSKLSKPKLNNLKLWRKTLVISKKLNRYKSRRMSQVKLATKKARNTNKKQYQRLPASKTEKSYWSFRITLCQMRYKTLRK
jgi:hypothetical protein